MSNKVQIADGIHVVKVSQDDYDDGIQKVVVELSDGSRYPQEFSWPAYTHDAFYKMRDLKIDHEATYLLMREIATQIKGDVLWFYGCTHKPSGFEYGKYKLPA